MSGQEDSEQGPLVEKNGGKDAEAGKPKKSPDWSRFGLSQEQQASTQKHYDSTVDTGDIGQQNELYREEQVCSSSGCDLFSLPPPLPFSLAPAWSHAGVTSPSLGLMLALHGRHYQCRN